MQKKSAVKRGPGRPPKQRIFPADELRAQAVQRLKESRERRLGLAEIDVPEFCTEVSRITGKHKFTKQEMDNLRETVDALYQKYVTDKWEEEAEYMEPYRDALAGIALYQPAFSSQTKMLTEEEWHLLHGRRPNGKKKPGPKKKKPKTVLDIELERGEPVDVEAIEQQLMDQTGPRLAPRGGDLNEADATGR